jgi:hypothetical protein
LGEARRLPYAIAHPLNCRYHNDDQCEKRQLHPAKSSPSVGDICQLAKKAPRQSLNTVAQHVNAWFLSVKWTRARAAAAGVHHSSSRDTGEVELGSQLPSGIFAVRRIFQKIYDMVPSAGQRPCHLTSPTTTRSSFARTSTLRFDADSSTQDGLSTAGSHHLSNGGALRSIVSRHGTPDSVFEGEYSHRRSVRLQTNVSPILRETYVPSCECGQAPTIQTRLPDDRWKEAVMAHAMSDWS